MFAQKFLKKGDRLSKRSGLKAPDSFSEVEVAETGGEIENTKCSRDSKTLAFGRHYAPPIVHQEKIRGE